MTGDCHVRFCESRGVRFPPATHQAYPQTTDSALGALRASMPSPREHNVQRSDGRPSAGGRCQARLEALSVFGDR